MSFIYPAFVTAPVAGAAVREVATDAADVPLSAATVLEAVAQVKDYRLPQLMGASAPLTKTPVLEFIGRALNVGVPAVALAALQSPEAQIPLAAGVLYAGVHLAAAVVPMPFQGLASSTLAGVIAGGLASCVGASSGVAGVVGAVTFAFWQFPNAFQFVYQWRDSNNTPFFVDYGGIRSKPNWWHRLTRTLVAAEDHLSQSTSASEYVFSGPLILEGDIDVATVTLDFGWNLSVCEWTDIEKILNLPVPTDGYRIDMTLRQGDREIPAQYRTHSREEILALFKCRDENGQIYVLGRFAGGKLLVEHALGADEARKIVENFPQSARLLQK